MIRGRIQEMEAAGEVREVASQYQQNPTPSTGGIFMPDALIKVARLEPEPPVRHMAHAYPDPPAQWPHRIMDCVRAWDLAATEQVGTGDPDWTVGLKMARLACGKYAVLDIVRFRGRPEQVEQRIVDTANADGKGVRIRISQDPGQAGKAQVGYYASKLAGYTVSFERETGKKATRADPVASQINAGNVLVIDAGWLPAFDAELRVFPAGAKDDQVDALGNAFASLASQGAPMRAIGINTTR